MKARIERFVSSLEETGDFVSLALYFAAFVTVRNIIECVLCEGKLLKASILFGQYSLFWAVALLLAMLWLSVFVGDARRGSRVATFGTAIVVAAPILDVLISGGGRRLGYLEFESFGQYFAAAASLFLTLPFSKPGRGLSPGLRIELYAIYALIFAYVLWRRKSLWRAFGAMYLFHLSLALFPGSVSFLSRRLAGIVGSAFGGVFVGTRYIRSASTLSLMLAILTPLWLRMLDGRYVKALSMSVRPVRLLHYGGMVALGVWLGCKTRVEKLLYLNLFDLAALFVGYLCLWFFGVFVNDLWDRDSDLIAGNPRPTALGILSPRETSIFAWGALVLGLVVLGALKSAVLKFGLLFAAAAYVYSAPPARTKRIPVISTLTLALASLAGAFMGYGFTSSRLCDFPGGVALAVVFGVTAGFVTKDLKDVAGDRAAGVLTVPGLVGERLAKPVCAALSAISIALIPVFTGVLLAAPLALAVVCAAAAAAYILAAKKVDERVPLAIYLSYAALYLALWYRL